jgi:hypothetical protein
MPFLVGSKLPSADLWSFTVPSPSISLSSSTALFSLQALPHARFVAYWHRAFGSPSLTTFMKALSRGFIHGIPDLTTSILRKFPPLSLSTAFGHLDTLRQGIASTTRSPPLYVPRSIGQCSPPSSLHRPNDFSPSMVGRRPHRSVSHPLFPRTRVYTRHCPS